MVAGDVWAGNLDGGGLGGAAVLRPLEGDAGLPPPPLRGIVPVRIKKNSFNSRIYDFNLTDVKM